TDQGPVARNGNGAICLACGATIELPEGDGALVGQTLSGGPPNPEALAKPSRGGRRGAASARRRTAAPETKGGYRSSTRHRRAPASASRRPAARETKGGYRRSTRRGPSRGSVAAGPSAAA